MFSFKRSLVQIKCKLIGPVIKNLYSRILQGEVDASSTDAITLTF